MSDRNTVDTLDVGTADDAIHEAREWALLVAAGPDAGTRFFLDASMPPRPLLGKSSVCELHLSDPSVSRRHAALTVTRQGLRVTDLGSTNGTFVGAVRIADAWVTTGQTIKVGSTVLQVLELPGKTQGARELGADRFGRLLGRSAVMRRLYPLFERAARSTQPVLIEGETGTGKELLAECLHELGSRSAGPFVVFDCREPHDLDDAIDQARGGTLVVDEIGELEPRLQATLLGGIGKNDVRIVSITRRDLDREAQEGRFRDDLYFRLAVLRLELPPLRARIDDIVPLAEHFHRLAGGDGNLPPDLVARFAGNNWPGNVRELANLVTRRVALGVPIEEKTAPTSEGSELFESVLALDLPLSRARERIVDAFERRYVERVLAKHGGNVGRAAAASGIARRYFQILRARHRDTT